MKKIILLIMVSIVFLNAENLDINNSVDINKTKKGCDSVEVKGCFDSNFMSNLLTKVCNKGNVKACYNLGLMYAKGEGITKNKPKAIELFQKACDAGVLQACEDYTALTTCEE